MQFDPPAELLLHHETVKYHDVRRQLADKGIKTAVVQFNADLINAQCSEVCLVFANAGRAAEGDVLALLQKTLDDLHHVPARRG